MNNATLFLLAFDVLTKSVTTDKQNSSNIVVLCDWKFEKKTLKTRVLLKNKNDYKRLLQLCSGLNT